MTVKLLTEHHLEFLSLKGGCKSSYESTLIKIPHCWKSRVTAHMSYNHRPSIFQRCSIADRSEDMDGQSRVLTRLTGMQFFAVLLVWGWALSY